jgi:hypothetical protein
MLAIIAGTKAALTIARAFSLLTNRTVKSVATTISGKVNAAQVSGNPNIENLIVTR